MQFSRILLVLLISICAVSFAGFAHALETDTDKELDEASPPQRSITLGKESVEALLQVLSPICRQEMASALSSQTEISMDCKVEIQAAIAELDTPVQEQEPMTNRDRYESDRQQQQQQGGSHSTRSTAAKPVPGNDSRIVMQILGFVAVLFAAVGGYVYHVNSKMPTSPRKTPKKKDKKN